MKKIIFLLLFLSVPTVAVLFIVFRLDRSLVSPLGKKTVKELPLLSYTFENLRHTRFPAKEIIIGNQVDETEYIISQLFYFSVPKSPESKISATVSGLMNLPKKAGTYPVIVMFRGFIPHETYRPGMGTQPSAQLFARHGFITLAPDFLGFGESASPSGDIFEARFQSYTTTLSLLSSLSTLNEGLEASFSGRVKADTARIGLWGHSNGGHIALSVLAISGASYPAVLWAPVSKSFPYSILFYTDEAHDQGKSLRRSLAQFESDYDTGQFSPPNFFSWIKAPLAVYQGESDHEVPVWWSDELVETLEKNGLDVVYKTYPNADHNLLPDGWSPAVLSSIAFYNSHF